MKTLFALFFCFISFLTVHVDAHADQLFDIHKKYFGMNKKEVAKDLNLKENTDNFLKNEIILNLNEERIPISVFYQFENDKLISAYMRISGKNFISTYNLLIKHLSNEYKKATKVNYALDDNSGFFYEWQTPSLTVQLLAFDNGNLSIDYHKKEPIDVKEKNKKITISRVLKGKDEDFQQEVLDKTKDLMLFRLGGLNFEEGSKFSNAISAKVNIQTFGALHKDFIQDAFEGIKAMKSTLKSMGIDALKDKVHLGIHVYSDIKGEDGKMKKVYLGAAFYTYRNDKIHYVEQN